MHESEVNSKYPDLDYEKNQSGILVLVCILFGIGVITLAGIGLPYLLHSNVSLIHCILVFFFAINFVICYWEVCLFYRRDQIRERADYWNQRWKENGRVPVHAFLLTKVPISKFMAFGLWADVWAAYCHFDDAYANCRTCGYAVDVGNGFIAPPLMLLLYFCYTFEFLSATVAGIIGVILFWQISYGTKLYWLSFFGSGSHNKLTRKDLLIYIVLLNTPWILFPLFGMIISIRLIIDNNYAIIGF